MKKKRLCMAVLLAVFLLAGITPAIAEDDPPPLPPGTVEGTGMYFEVTDSEYLNVTLESTEPIHVMLESVPQMVVMHLETAEGATPTQINLGGFPPLTTYYKYEDDYHNEVIFTTDASGEYTYVQDLSEPHLVFIQTNAGTYFISNDATGGDCTLIGTWDSGTKTCTLTGVVSDAIQIDSDYVTLDGAGYTVSGPRSGVGIHLPYRTGVTLKDLRVEHFLYGIILYSSSYNQLKGNIASNIGHGIRLYYSSSNTLKGNTTSWNNDFGIHLHYSSYNQLKENIASNNYYGIILGYSKNNQLTGNIASNNSYGIRLYITSNNEIYNNNFIDNSVFQVYLYASSNNLFNLSSPIGGNYWSDWTTPDSDGDGFVDNPYVFTGGQDNLPWTRQDGWLNQAPEADAGDNIQILSADQAYTVIQGIATDPDEDPLEYRWLEGTEVLLDWTPVGISDEAYLDLGTLPYLSIGNHTMTLEVTDGKLTATDEMILTINNSPPEAQPAPSSQVVEIGIDPIGVVADVLDFDGDTVTYEWLKDTEVLGSGSLETVQGGETVQIPDLYVPEGDPLFPLGIHQIELRVSDGINPPVSAFVWVEVIDTTAPSLSPIPSVTMLWPPNHKLQPCLIQANAYDNGGGAITLDCAVTCSEPPDADGDGNTIPDYYIDTVDNETGLIELQLRSERSGKGDGRTYTIVITARDESDNSSVATVEVLAPHDKRKK